MKKSELGKLTAPQMGANEEYAEVASWEVEEGDFVEQGQVVLVLETTKATFEVEANESGHIYFVYEESEEVRVGEVVAVLSDEKDDNLVERFGKEKEEKPEYEDLKLTEAARDYLDSINGDPSQLPMDRILRKEDVREYLGHESEREEQEEETDVPERVYQRVAIAGAGRGGTTLLEAIRLMSGYQPVGFLETDQKKIGTTHGELPVWEEDLPHLIEDRNVGSIAIGFANRERRLEIVRCAQRYDIHPINVLHREAWIAPSVLIGAGNFVKAGAVIETESQVGDACIVDNGVEVPHHCTIQSGVHLAPGVTMGGGVEIGERTLVGVGVTIAPEVKISENVIVSPGSTVMDDFPGDVILEGSPAEVIGSRN